MSEATYEGYIVFEGTYPDFIDCRIQAQVSRNSISILEKDGRVVTISFPIHRFLCNKVIFVIYDRDAGTLEPLARKRDPRVITYETIDL